MLELNYGRRYGLLGRNGSGKSTFLKALAARDLGIPEHIDMYLLNEEAAPTEFTALQTVVEQGKQEVARLEKEEERLMDVEGPESPLLQDLYAKLEELDPVTFEKRAGELLFGLGFGKVRSRHSFLYYRSIYFCIATMISLIVTIITSPNYFVIFFGIAYCGEVDKYVSFFFSFLFSSIFLFLFLFLFFSFLFSVCFNVKKNNYRKTKKNN